MSSRNVNFIVAPPYDRRLRGTDLTTTFWNQYPRLAPGLGYVIVEVVSFLLECIRSAGSSNPTLVVPHISEGCPGWSLYAC